MVSWSPALQASSHSLLRQRRQPIPCQRWQPLVPLTLGLRRPQTLPSSVSPPAQTAPATTSFVPMAKSMPTAQPAAPRQLLPVSPSAPPRRASRSTQRPVVTGSCFPTARSRVTTLRSTANPTSHQADGGNIRPVSYTHLRAHETVLDIV